MGKLFIAKGKECYEQPNEYNCLVEDVCRYYGKLQKQLVMLQPKRRRLYDLSKPPRVTPKYQPQEACVITRVTRTIRDVRVSTRLEQLAYPPVRRVLKLKQENGYLFQPERIQIVNRTLRKSILSLYSRLANIRAPVKRVPIPKWSKKEWKTHKTYLKKLAQPKKIFYPVKEPHIWKELKLMTRFKKLAKPKRRYEPPAFVWQLTPGLKKYKASARMLILAKPKERDESARIQTLPIKISPEAMRYKATERIKKLATPPEVRMGESDLKENPFGTSPNALKAKCSDRVTELAQAKEYTDKHTRPNPFLISPAALKCKPTPRIIELAKPKGK